MAANNATIADPQGDYDDWIEIYNAGASPVNLGGYFITNDIANPDKWQIPTYNPTATTVPAGGYLLLWADEDITDGVTHLDRKLKSGGDFVALFATDALTLIDSIGFQAQTDDVSYGRETDGTSNFYKMTNPTPNATNIFNPLPGTLTPYTNLYINEIMPNNDTLADGYGDFDDWLEIYNGNANTVDIGGLYLTDDLDDLLKWQITTNHQIGASGHTVIWADNEPEQGDLHTTFKLSSTGDFIALIQKIGNQITILDSLTFGEFRRNISYGRKTDGSNTHSQFVQFSPGNTNNGKKKLVDEVKFSIKGGLHSASQNVTFSCTTPNVTIRYTTDGSEPTSSSPSGTSVNVSSTRNIRAKAFKSGWQESFTTSESYLINVSHHLPVVNIATNPDNLWDNQIGIHVIGTNGKVANCRSDPRNYNQDWERPATVQMYETDGTLAFNIDAGISISGGCSRNNAQKSINIATKKRYGTEEIDYQLFPTRNQDEFRRFKLRNAGNDWNLTSMRDAVVQALVKDEVDIETQEFRPSVVYLNGEYWGIMSIRDVFSEHYLNYKFPDIDKDSIDLHFLHLYGDVNQYDVEVKEGHHQAFLDLYNYIDDNSMSNASNYEYVKSLMDINEYLNYQIVQIHVANTDWPSNNTRVWRDQRQGGKFRWILFDTDFALGRQANGSNSRTANPPSMNSLYQTVRTDQGGWPNDPASTEMLRKLLQNNEFKHEFIQRFATQINLLFTSSRTATIVDDYKATMQPEMQDHLNKWNLNGGSLSTWRGRVDYLKTWLADRPPYMRQHIQSHFGLNGTYNLTIDFDANSGGYVLLNSNEYPAPYNYSGIYFDNIPIEITAVAHEGYVFSHWQQTGDTNAKTSYTSSSNATLTPVFRRAPMISEIHYHPANGGDYEFIKITNPENGTIELTNFQFTNGIEHTFGNLTLQANEEIILAKKASLHSSQPLRVFQWTSGSLDNDGEKITLRDTERRLVDTIRYADIFPWNEEADGYGPSLCLSDISLDNGIASNWTICPVRHDANCLLGNIQPDLDMWLKASEGIVEGATPNAPKIWQGQNGSGVNGSQFTNTNQAQFIDNQINGNPVMRFDGTDDWMKYNGAATPLSDNSTVFAVITPQPDNDDGYFLSTHLGGSNRLKFGHNPNGHIIYDDDVTPLDTLTDYHGKSTLVSFDITASQVDGFINGIAAIPWTTDLNISNANHASLGQEFDGSGSDSETSNHWKGDMAEMMIFNNVINANTRHQIESYFSVKYGITIPVSNHNYYNHASHPNDLAGIGRDLVQCLEQHSSRSINPTSIVTMTTPTILPTNSFLVWGNDGASTNEVNTGLPFSIPNRLERTWRITQTGNSGAVDIQFDLAGLGLDLSDTTHLNLLIDSDDGDFANAQIVPVSNINGNILTFEAVNFSDGDWFTLGTQFLDCIDIQLYAFLEGPYDSTTTEMTTALGATRGLLPGQTPVSNLITPTPPGQPYNAAPWNYTGTEGATWTDADYTGDEVDWVLVSFRTAIEKNTQVAQGAALLHKDGSLHFPDRCVLNSALGVTSAYIIIEHRNHVAAMSPQAIPISNGIFSYDFRWSNSYTASGTGFGQKQTSTGEWLMFTGDSDQSDFPSYDIQGTDKTLWLNENGIFDQYRTSDFNLDGDINGQDKSLWYENNGISSRIPK